MGTGVSLCQAACKYGDYTRKEENIKFCSSSWLDRTLSRKARSPGQEELFSLNIVEIVIWILN